MCKKKILVTGSLGYIGSVLTPHLIKRGHDVFGFDTGFYKDCTLYDSNDADVLNLDMRDFNEEFLEDVDAVVHLASIGNDPFGNLSVKDIYDPITEYSLSLATLCKKKNIRFIWPSSCSVYGVSKNIIDEDSSLNPQTAYSKNKVEFEEKLISISDDSFQPIILRLATLYGLSSRIRFDLVLNMFAGMAYLDKKIVLNSTGESWRPFVHINDVAEAITCCVENDPINNLDYPDKNAVILNVGNTNDNYTILELAKIVSSMNLGTTIEFINYQKKMDKENIRILDQNINDGIDVRTYRVSFEKIKKVFPGFETNWTVKKGIKTIFEKFEEINFLSEEFKDPKFYRLKTLEKFYSNGLIDNQLKWIK